MSVLADQKVSLEQRPNGKSVRFLPAASVAEPINLRRGFNNDEPAENWLNVSEFVSPSDMKTRKGKT